MNIGKDAINLLGAFEIYLEVSSKKDYIFTPEEQRALENLIRRLNNQIDMLVDYEIKRSKGE